MRKFLVLISGIVFTLAAASFTPTAAQAPAAKAKAACCDCSCGNNCSPGACPAHCGCCCDN